MKALFLAIQNQSVDGRRGRGNILYAAGFRGLLWEESKIPNKSGTGKLLTHSQDTYVCQLKALYLSGIFH